MFNPTTPREMLLNIGRAIRAVARDASEFDEASRVQLLSAYSACRHLAVEVEEFPAAIEQFAESLNGIVQQDSTGQLAAIVVDLQDDMNMAEIAKATCNLLDEIHASPTIASLRMREEVRTLIKWLVDTEIAVLASEVEKADVS